MKEAYDNTLAIYYQYNILRIFTTIAFVRIATLFPEAKLVHALAKALSLSSFAIVSPVSSTMV